MHFAQWQQFHGPLVGFAVALGLALAGRFLRVALLAAAAGAAGVVAGWYAVIGRQWAVSPQPSVDELTALAAIALLIGLLCTWLGPGRQAWIGILLAALAAGWFLSGGPRNLAAFRASWPNGLGVAIAVLLFGRALTVGALDPLRLALAALTLAVALHIAGTPPIWTQLALVPGLAALAMCTLPPMPGLAALPVVVDIAALGCLVMMAHGRLPRLGFAPVDAAALSPLLAIWLQPHTAERLRRIGRAAPLGGCLLAGAIAVGCVWLVRLYLNR
ncbi:MAG TPA: hypothetical protein VKI44_22930 [Acetobacteraceae bacterium]|nr:hypothetical protein [Acetobacteraceae bacterium]